MLYAVIYDLLKQNLSKEPGYEYSLIKIRVKIPEGGRKRNQTIPNGN
jgi:hypothetical protein